ncbi:Appr-1-p processing protein [Nonomuraea sp. KM90]|uniref:Appr-1-p processing protein n=1 Tax=Nonomuraea sp. KM90 TaxID=3457428 RepID=UPI003FCCB9FB
MRYVTGDATAPDGDGPRIIAHICNSAGRWGRGFVVALSSRWDAPEKDYRTWYAGRDYNDFGLGAIRIVQVAHELWVANMIAQHGIRPIGAVPPIRYGALERCLLTLATEATRRHASVHLPRIGAGLAGGTWDRIEPLLRASLSSRDIPVTVYDLPVL